MDRDPIGLPASDEYLRKRALLSDRKFESLRLVEEAVIVDPIGRLRRRELDDGRMMDSSEEFLMVFFWPEGPAMDDLIDLEAI